MTSHKAILTSLQHEGRTRSVRIIERDLVRVERDHAEICSFAYQATNIAALTARELRVVVYYIYIYIYKGMNRTELQ